jgi:CheY-like chemotaxis protein
MSSPAPPRRRVLFVDDDPQFLAVLKEMMEMLSGGAWEIETADGARNAFVLLQRHTVDLAVVDLRMGVMDGVQMLSLLNRGHPQIQKVVLSGFPSEESRAACLANGAELFLEKPKTSADWQNLHVTLNELLRVTPEPGFRGVLRRVGLADVLQMECLGRNSSVLEVMDRTQRGEIFIEEGSIIHAQVGELSGEDAFNQLLSLSGGQFNLKPFQKPPARTIEGQWEFLLMEAARKKDEMAVVEGERALADIPSQPAVAEALPPELYEPELPPGGETPAPATTAPDLAPPTITQMLVCSTRGEILHNWQVLNSDAWISFLEFLSQRAQRLSQSLELGDFDYLEIESPRACFLLLLSAVSGVMIRSEMPAPRTETIEDGNKEPIKVALIAWQKLAPQAPGELLRALHFPDKMFVCDKLPSSFRMATVEQAWGFVTDAFHVLAANRVVADKLVWHFQNGTLHAVRRRDGTVFGVLIGPSAADPDGGSVEALVQGFRLCNTKPG